MKMTPLERLIPAEEALRRLLKASVPVRRTEVIALERAVGRVAAGPVTAPRPIPAFVRATWDGYALRSADARVASPRAPVRLRVVGELHAEERLPRALRQGECAAIATGAALPPGANCVEIFENVREDPEGAWIELRGRVPKGHCLAEPGEDVPKGERLVSEGEVLTPARLGAIGATGRDRVKVYARPLVVLVPNGNELVPPGGPLAPGQVHEFNNFTLGALVAACGGEPMALPPVADDLPVLQGTLEGALRSADMVIASGGSSVGERDYLPQVFPRLGKLLFHGIAVRPGKPTLAASAREKLLVGMPGHPTSCLSNGLWLLRPALRKLAHLSGPGTFPMRARISREYAAPSGGFSTVVPVHYRGGWAEPTFRGSSAITSLTSANGYALLPPHTTRLRRGAWIDLQLLPEPVAAWGD